MSIYLQRTLERFITGPADRFPVLLLTGARQVGKTCLLRRTLTTFCHAVIDGDTIIVDIGGNQAKVRLLGINAPEIGRPATRGPRPA